MSGERKFLILLGFAILIALIIIFSTSDKLWNDVDNAITPHLSYDKDEHTTPTASASADARGIQGIQIGWVTGNIAITYAHQTRITWLETYTKGIPPQNVLPNYWMNTHTLYLDFFVQDQYLDLQNQRDEIVKDLQMTIPVTCQLNDLFIRCAKGDISITLPNNTSFFVNTTKHKGEFVSDIKTCQNDIGYSFGSEPYMQINIEGSGNLYIAFLAE